MDNNQRQIADLVKRLALTEELFRTAMRRALNKTMRSVARGVSSDVAQELGIPARLLKQRMKQSTGIMNSKTMEERLSIIAYDLPLILANARQTPSGVRADGGRDVPGAFIAAGRYGSLPRRVFRRVGTARGPIAEQKIRVVDAIRANIDQQLAKSAQDFFLKTFEQEVRRGRGLVDV